MRKIVAVVAVSCLTTLYGCGGGGGAGNAGAAPPAQDASAEKATTRVGPQPLAATDRAGAESGSNAVPVIVDSGPLVLSFTGRTAVNMVACSHADVVLAQPHVIGRADALQRHQRRLADRVFDGRVGHGRDYDSRPSSSPPEW